MIDKFEDAVLRLFYPTAEEPAPADTSSEINTFTQLDDTFGVETGEKEVLEPAAALAVDTEGGDEDGSTSPGKPALSRAQRKRLKRRIQTQERSAKGKRFIGPRLPDVEDTAAATVQSGVDRREKQDTQCIAPSGKQGPEESGGAVLASKTRKRRLAKKMWVENGGHPASQPQGTAFVVDVVGKGVVLKHLS